MTKNASQGSINQQIFPLIPERFLSELPEPPLDDPLGGEQIPLVRQVMHQTRERLFKGSTHVPDRLGSLFEQHTE